MSWYWVGDQFCEWLFFLSYNKIKLILKKLLNLIEYMTEVASLADQVTKPESIKYVDSSILIVFKVKSSFYQSSKFSLDSPS